MRVAVTGASGFIGSELVTRLRADGHVVVRIGRSEGMDVPWDPARGVLDAGALEGLDAVVHLAGAPIARRWTAARRHAIRTSRVEGTTLLARTLAGLAHPPAVLLSGSAIGIYGSRGDERLDETSAPGRDFLADTAQAWERATGPAEAAGIRVVHLRTGIVQGSGGGALAVQLPVFRLGLGGVLGNGQQWMSPIALTDHVAAMMFCLENDGLRGPVNLVAPEPVTNAAYTRLLGTVLHRPTVARVPAFMLRLLFGTEMANLTVLASQRVEPRALQRAGFVWRAPSVEQILQYELR
ncbi:TIGR01777 family oxidoreductase [Gemmatimonas aurantiaca]|uniref:TIGR01777 family oxidoreductase n=1 Tax=Gemmatimonas aurantiaca TaxID=173480 RepID=UPI00301D39A7